MKTPTNKLLHRLMFLLLTLGPLGHCHFALAYYDPGIQRWLSRDPLAEQGFQTTPKERYPRIPSKAELLQEPNLYGFVRNMSIERTDPDGLELLPPLGPKSPLGTPGVPCNLGCLQECGAAAATLAAAAAVCPRTPWSRGCMWLLAAYGAATRWCVHCLLHPGEPMPPPPQLYEEFASP